MPHFSAVFPSLALPVLAIWFSSCASVQPLEVRSVVCCDIKKMVKSDAEVAFSVEIYNPNTFPITIKGYDLDVAVNGNAIGKAINEEATQIGPNGTETRSVSLMASTEKLIGGTLLMGLNALFGNSPTTLEIQVSGSVVGAAKGVSKRVRIKETYPLKLQP